MIVRVKVFGVGTGALADTTCRIDPGAHEIGISIGPDLVKALSDTMAPVLAVSVMPEPSDPAWCHPIEGAG